VRYSEAFKASMVQKLADPRGPSANQLALEVGVPQSTLSRWRLRAASASIADTLSFTDHRRSRMFAKRPQDWSAEEKLAAVIEAATLPDEDLGAFLRRKGLHEAQLGEWRQQVLSGLASRPARASRPTGEARRVKELEKELRRKDKALAEAAALLVIQKKVRAIWGDEDDDTAKKNGL